MVPLITILDVSQDLSHLAFAQGVADVAPGSAPEAPPATTPTDLPPTTTPADGSTGGAGGSDGSGCECFEMAADCSLIIL